MRLTSLFLVLVCIHVSGATRSQTVTLNVKQQPITQVLASIEDQTGYLIVYNDRYVTRDLLVSLQVTDQSLETVLDQVLAPRGLTYQIQGKTIAIRGRRNVRISRKPAADILMPKQRTVSGRVTDEEGNPLEGVTVTVKGTSIAVTSDASGNYRIPIPESGDALTFTIVGFNAAERSLGGSVVIDVTMTPSISDLDEVVVVGYGTQKRSDITGSIASVDVDDLNGIPIRSVDQALQGRVAGVNFTQNSGMPGAGSAIRIRGGNSITGSNEPLYVIDGVPVFANPGNNANNLNPLNTINITDIESIDVLKDASATAIYGSRGGNGVIIITTKRGRKGKPQVNVESYAGVQSVTKRYELLGASQFEQLANEATTAEGGLPIYDLSLTPQTNDWQDLILVNAPIQNYQLSVSGGSEATQYLVAGNYFKQDGVARTSDMQRYAFRESLDQGIGEHIKIGQTISATNVTVNKINGNSLLTMLTLPPNVPVLQPDGSYTMYMVDGQQFNNPIALLLHDTNLNSAFRTLGNMYGSVRFLDHFTFKSLWGLDVIFNRNDSYTPQTVFTGAQVGGSATVNNAQTFTWLNENTLNYNHSFGKHSIDALLGFTQQHSIYKALMGRAQGFLNDNLGTNALQNGSEILAPSSGIAEWTIHSYIGRVNYGFDNRYLVTLTGRYDGSSRFGRNNRFGFFPSVGLAWRVDQEPFMADQSLFSNLKLRATHGLTGNQDGIGNNPSLDLLGAVQYTLGGTRVIGLTPSQMSNVDLKWESTRQTNVGIDMGFWNERLTLVMDAYYKKTHDLLLSVTIPSTSGFTSTIMNVGSVENKGVEVTVAGTPIDGAWTWNSSFNIAFNRNKVLDLGGEERLFLGQGPNESTVVQVGYPLGTFFGFPTRGTYYDVEDVANSAEPNAKPGDIRYVDTNQDRAINDDDRTLIGNAQPDFIGGFMNSFGYKGVGLDIFVQGSYGGQLYNANRISLENVQGLRNQSIVVMDRWTPENRTAIIPRASSVKPAARSLDRYVEDGSFLRIKSIQLSYQLPSHWVQRIRATNVRIYVNAQNLYTITDYSGLDPEVSRYGSDNVSPGFDNGAYPNVRTFTFGFNVNF